MPSWRRTIQLQGVVFDSRAYDFDPETPTLPPPIWTGGDEMAEQAIEIEGVLVTAALDIGDGRKNWADLVSAFIAALGDKADAVLLLQLARSQPDWMQALYRWLAAQPAFACRVLAVRGPMEGEARDELIGASHWYASASNAEAVTLPMLDFLAAGRPAVAPAHTALADHLHPDSALIVASDEEDWRWPEDVRDAAWSFTQHPDDVGPTTRSRLSWTSLAAALEEAYRLVTVSPQDYGQMSAAAVVRTRTACSPEAAAAALRELLVREADQGGGPAPSPFMQKLAAE